MRRFLRPGRPAVASGRLALISGYPPTTSIGGGIILRRLLTGLEPQLVIACSGAEWDSTEVHGDGGLLDCDHRLFRPWTVPAAANRVPLVYRLMRVVNFLRTPVIAVRLVGLVRGRTVLLVPCAGKLGDELFVAGWLAATIAGSKLVVYEMDDWDASLNGQRAWVLRVVGRAVHGRILRRASTVLAISPPLAERFRKCYETDAEVLAGAAEPRAKTQGGPATVERPNIVFIGAIYGAQADAIARLVRAVERLPKEIEVVLYTTLSAAALAACSIAGPRLRLKERVPGEQVFDILQQASMVFLPASFLPEQRRTVTTSLPMKTAEYLWSGIPVLVHGPPDSVVARLARDEGWGVVVDTEDEELLASAVLSLLEDPELRSTVTTQARKTAAARHDLGLARRRIREAVGVEEPPGSGR